MIRSCNYYILIYFTRKYASRLYDFKLNINNNPFYLNLFCCRKTTK